MLRVIRKAIFVLLTVKKEDLLLFESELIDNYREYFDAVNSERGSFFKRRYILL